jgi:hypothetical protein
MENIAQKTKYSFIKTINEFPKEFEYYCKRNEDYEA